MPIQRFGSTLVSKGQFSDYMQLLKDNFSVANLDSVMCKTLVSVDYEGYLYDCDFNQMLEKRVKLSKTHHISKFNYTQLMNRNIALDQHCFACTAGMGSSCSGSLV